MPWGIPTMQTSTWTQGWRDLIFGHQRSPQTQDVISHKNTICWMLNMFSDANSDASRALMSSFQDFLTRQNLSDWPSCCFFLIIYILDLNPSLLKSCKSLQGPFVGHCSNVCEHTGPSMCLSVLCVCGEWGSDGLTDRAKETAHLVKLTTFPWPSPHGMHSIWETEWAV